MARVLNYLPKRKRMWLLLLASLLLVFALISCGPTKLTITHANLKPSGAQASPVLISQQTTLDDWETHIKLDLQIKLQKSVYGFLPKSSSTRVLEHKVLTNTAYDGLATIEEYKLVATAIFGETSNDTKPFIMVVVDAEQYFQAYAGYPHGKFLPQ